MVFETSRDARSFIVALLSLRATGDLESSHYSNKVRKQPLYF